MSWDESLHYAHQLTGIHPWTGYMIEVVALQQTLKEACHKMQVAREFTHERTKQRIAHLNAIAMAPAVKAQPVMPQRLPRGEAWLDDLTSSSWNSNLKNWTLTSLPSCTAPPCWVLDRGTPEHKQFDSACKDAKEDKGDAMSALDAKLNASTGEEMDATGSPAHMPSADRCWRRNRTLRRERNRACREFHRPKSRQLSFPLFQETTKEDAISYQDWRSKI